MNFGENISLAIASLKANKMRAFLTMLGIIIGIGSVIMITTLGGVLTQTVNGSFADMGASNNIQFYIKFNEKANRDYYTDSDLLAYDDVFKLADKFSDRLDDVLLQSHGMNGKVTKNRKDYNVDVNGISYDAARTQSSMNLIEGRDISAEDCKNERNVIIITDKLAESIFPDGEYIGKKVDVNINNKIQTFSVIGIFEYKVNKMSAAMIAASGQDTSTTSFIPVTTANRLNGKSDDTFYNFMVYSYPGVNLKELADDICKYLNTTYYRNNNAVHIESWIPEDSISQMNDILDIVSIVITIIAGISLLVGGIGVMNIMLVSVTERTKEIGVRKALGAPNSAIRSQFIIESMIICLIGGVLGVILGLLLGNIACLIAGEFAPPNILSIVIAVLFSMGIGVFFGYYPANRAAKLDPIEALRYE